LAAVVGVCGHRQRVLAFGLADPDRALQQLDIGAVEVVAREQVDQLGRPNRLDQELARGVAAARAGQLDLDVWRAVGGDVAGLDAEDALRVVLVLARGPLPECAAAPWSLLRGRVEPEDAHVPALLAPGLPRLAQRFLRGRQAGAPDHRMRLPVPVEASREANAQPR